MSQKIKQNQRKRKKKNKKNHIQLFQEWWEEGIKENDGGGEFKYDIFDLL
jgi:hypothetical protein